MFDKLLTISNQLKLSGVKVGRGRIYSVELLWLGYSGEIKDGPMLITATGYGETLDAASADYLEKIQGRRMVFDAYGDHRYEVVIPILE